MDSSRRGEKKNQRELKVHVGKLVRFIPTIYLLSFDPRSGAHVSLLWRCHLSKHPNFKQMPSTVRLV